MAKQLTFTYNDKDYTLEYTRRTVAETERRGFVADELDKKPATMIPLLFQGAFLAHHRNTDRTLIDEIYNWMTHKKALIGALAEMYVAPLNDLVGGDEDDEEDTGNANWAQS